MFEFLLDLLTLTAQSGRAALAGRVLCVSLTAVLDIPATEDVYTNISGPARNLTQPCH